ncbi:hypothetical protein [Streptomyces sp. NPDC056491]|uniref:lamin tail domain-containing protein n=1 Tax=Streptomyces sp. NPDC056491 TaxID=3345837 RepID=UPI0036BC5C7A
MGLVVLGGRREGGGLIDGFIVERLAESDYNGALAALAHVVSPEVVLSPAMLALARVGNRYRFDNVRIGSRATIRIHTGNGRDTRTDLFQDRRDYVWDNRFDTAIVRDDRGRTVDTETWGPPPLTPTIRRPPHAGDPV